MQQSLLYSNTSPLTHARIRVLIADDHPRFRSVLRRLLELDSAIEVVGEAGNGDEACTMAQECVAQVVCMDFRMAQMDGIESTRKLIQAMPGIKIIGLSASFEASTELEMLAAGATCYVPKAKVADELLPTIHALFAYSAR